ncbi:MAG: hypothetical protein IJ751_06595, partial [Oscillospiraceae bacterium]|nr:hypothetical protein [Oscillospiraceae bacterium]
MFKNNCKSRYRNGASKKRMIPPFFLQISTDRTQGFSSLLEERPTSRPFWAAAQVRRHKRFAAGKTLAKGGFTPPEQVKSPWGGGGDAAETQNKSACRRRSDSLRSHASVRTCQSPFAIGSASWVLTDRTQGFS